MNRRAISGLLSFIPIARRLSRALATRMIHNILLTFALALTLEVSLLPQQLSQSADPAQQNTANTETYRLYQLGRFHWNKRTVSDLRTAIEYFQKVVIADPNYAPAYAGLADSYMLLSEADGAAPGEAIPKARQAALKALSLDNESAEAHTALGLALFHDYDLAGAEREFKRALELNSQNATAHQRYGFLLACLGRHEEGLVEVRRALEIEPRALVFNRSYGINLFYARRYEESIAQLKKTQKLDAKWAPAYASLANAYWMKGDYAKSVKEFAKYREAQGRPRDAALVRESFSKARWEGFLRMRIAELRGSTTNSYGVAEYHAALGEKDEAFAALNKADENHDYGLVVIKVDPRLDSLRDDPRFQDLLRRVGFSH
jgi:tetratricopeptide (TPR) repeat protein